jgi:regulator of sirC expression with transglutaminase-like and TPR domain
MARAQARRRPPRSQPKRKSRSAEDLMFFPRLRRRAKWVFLFLALAFGLGFVAFGVGTGVSGTSLGDVLQDFLGQQGSPDEAVDDAAEKAAANPDDADAQLAYASALAGAGRTQQAIDALENYTRLKPRDADALRQLAVLYGTQAARARQESQTAQAQAQQASAGQIFAGQDELGQALSQNKIAETIAAEANARAQAAQARAQQSSQQEARVWEQLSLLTPDDPSVFLQLGAASQAAQDYDAAIAAYEQFLDLAPDDSSAPLVKEQLKLLRQVQGAPGAGNGG